MSDAGRFRDHLFARGMSSSSVKRVFSSVRSIVNLAIREQGLAINNIFSGTLIPDDGAKQQRAPIPLHALQRIQSNCQTLDDEPRWLFALISDSGMRLSEACGLLASDIHIDTDSPFIELKEHPWRSAQPINKTAMDEKASSLGSRTDIQRNSYLATGPRTFYVENWSG